MSEALDPLLHMFHKICSYKDCRGNECRTRVTWSWIWVCISPWLWTVFVRLWNSQLCACQTLTMRLSSGFLGSDDVHDLWLWLIAFRINHKHWPGASLPICGVWKKTKQDRRSARWRRATERRQLCVCVCVWESWQWSSLLTAGPLLSVCVESLCGLKRVSDALSPSDNAAPLLSIIRFQPREALFILWWYLSFHNCLHQASFFVKWDVFFSVLLLFFLFFYKQRPLQVNHSQRRAKRRIKIFGCRLLFKSLSIFYFAKLFPLDRADVDLSSVFFLWSFSLFMLPSIYFAPSPISVSFQAFRHIHDFQRFLLVLAVWLLLSPP